ncbi:MAG TPA: phosphatase PAP2 family protein [Solirubrobacterales bacterium]|nr:phosphatase PAP2 family protein [Solirubrobacterales bacterium]
MAGHVKAPLAAWLACAGALVLLALVAYGINAAQHADATLLAKLIARQDSAAWSVTNAIAHLADPAPLLVMLALACGIALWRGRPLDAVAAVVVVLGASVTTQVLKVLLAHPRYQAVLGHHQLGPIAFPSGHATAATSIAIAFVFVAPRRMKLAAAVLGAGFVAAVGLSVLVIAWHYPSDVLGGVLVACGWGFAVLAATRAISPRGSRDAGVSRRAPLPSP